MNETEKLKMLKQKYLNEEHPHWKKEQWLKKIDVVFNEPHWKKEWSYPVQIIRTLEFCYSAPDKKIRMLGDEVVYSNDVKLKEKYDKLIKERTVFFNKRVKETTKWFESL